jgi:CheY-like chemotaxis protein
MRRSDPAKTATESLIEPQYSSPAEDDTHLRVLLAEDNPVNRKLMMHLLRRLGHSVDIAVNGAEAVDAFRRRRHKLILMDSQMPVVDGLEATRQIREIEGDSRTSIIISVTASVLNKDPKQWVADGMDDYIPKPVNTTFFEERMRYWTDLIKFNAKLPELSLT